MYTFLIYACLCIAILTIICARTICSILAAINHALSLLPFLIGFAGTMSVPPTIAGCSRCSRSQNTAMFRSVHQKSPKGRYHWLPLCLKLQGSIGGKGGTTWWSPTRDARGHAFEATVTPAPAFKAPIVPPLESSFSEISMSASPSGWGSSSSAPLAPSAPCIVVAKRRRSLELTHNNSTCRNIFQSCCCHSASGGTSTEDGGITGFGSCTGAAAAWLRGTIGGGIQRKLWRLLAKFTGPCFLELGSLPAFFLLPPCPLFDMFSLHRTKDQ